MSVLEDRLLETAEKLKAAEKEIAALKLAMFHVQSYMGVVGESIKNALYHAKPHYLDRVEMNLKYALEGIDKIDSNGPDIMSQVLHLVAIERGRQEVEWLSQDHHHDFMWCAILGEEVGEVHKEALEIHTDGNGTIDNLKAELVQVAAVAVAWYEKLMKQEPQTGTSIEKKVLGKDI